jgi:CRP/FNR family transcriptional regulator, dissimilatory nitrate respiration regulator
MPTWRSTFPGRQALDTKFWMSLVDPARAGHRRLAAGEALFRQGDAPVALHVVRDGRVRLVRHLEDGSTVALHVAQANETLAEAALFADAYHCDAVADIPSEVTTVPKADLLAALEADPRACLALAKGLASHLRDLRAQLELRSIRSAPERILFWLRLHANGAPPTVRVDRPWTEIAAEIGLTREVVYRALAALERDGRIRREQGRVVLRPPAGGMRHLR